MVSSRPRAISTRRLISFFGATTQRNPAPNDQSDFSQPNKSGETLPTPAKATAPPGTTARVITTTDEVLSAAGFSPDEITSLRDEGVVA